MRKRYKPKPYKTPWFIDLAILITVLALCLVCWQIVVKVSKNEPWREYVVIRQGGTQMVENAPRDVCKGKKVVENNHTKVLNEYEYSIIKNYRVLHHLEIGNGKAH